jgi:aminopeptidase N
MLHHTDSLLEDENARQLTNGRRGSPSKLRSRKKQAKRERYLEDAQYGAPARLGSPLGSTENDDTETDLPINKYYAQQRLDDARRNRRDNEDAETRYPERSQQYYAPPPPTVQKQRTEVQFLDTINDILVDSVCMLFSLLKKPL